MSERVQGKRILKVIHADHLYPRPRKIANTPLTPIISSPPFLQPGWQCPQAGFPKDPHGK